MSLAFVFAPGYVETIGGVREDPDPNPDPNPDPSSNDILVERRTPHSVFYQPPARVFSRAPRSSLDMSSSSSSSSLSSLSSSSARSIFYADVRLNRLSLDETLEAVSNRNSVFGGVLLCHYFCRSSLLDWVKRLYLWKTGFRLLLGTE